jgi:hypothetical protein
MAPALRRDLVNLSVNDLITTARGRCSSRPRGVTRSTRGPQAPVGRYRRVREMAARAGRHFTDLVPRARPVHGPAGHRRGRCTSRRRLDGARGRPSGARPRGACIRTASAPRHRARLDLIPISGQLGQSIAEALRSRTVPPGGGAQHREPSRTLLAAAARARPARPAATPRSSWTGARGLRRDFPLLEIGRGGRQIRACSTWAWVVWSPADIKGAIEIGRVAAPDRARSSDGASGVSRGVLVSGAAAN